MKRKANKIFVLSTLTLGCMFGINKMIKYKSDIKNTLSDKSGAYYKWKYGNIFYKKEGTGSPLLCIHDLNVASSSYDWKTTVKHLKKNHTVYCIDLLGCGQSDKPYITYINYTFVQLITDFIKDVIKEKPDIIVDSNSVPCVLMTAALHSDHIGKIIMMNPPALKSNETSNDLVKRMKKRVYELPIVGTSIYNFQLSKLKLEEREFKKLYSKNITAEDKEVYYANAHTGTGKFLFGSIQSEYTKVDLIPILNKITNKLYIISSREYSNQTEITEQYLHYNSTIEPMYISKCKGKPQIEQTEKTCKFIESFLEENE